jgi:uncharacterized membrane protein YqhA
MVGALLKLRWLAVVIAAFCALDAVAFVVLGILQGIAGYRIILHGGPWTGEHLPGVELARSLDAFLIALVFIVFSIGVTELFVVREGASLEAVPAWMRVTTLTELKFLLWETLLVTLVVASMEGVVVTAREPAWVLLVAPAATLILALGLYFSRKAR